MKVGIAAIRVADLQGGNTESLYALASALEKLGTKVSFLLPQLKKQIPFEVEFFGDSKTFYHRFETGTLRLMFQFLRKIPEFSQKVDVLHVSLPTPAYCFLADMVAKRSICPVVVNLDAALYEKPMWSRLLSDPSLAVRSIINSQYIARLAKFVCRFYVVSSQYQARELEKLGCPSPKIKIIPNTFNLSKMEATMQLDESTAKTVTYVGHYNWHKGVDVFLRAIPKIRASRPDVRFVVAWSGRGDDTSVQRLVKELELADKVTFPGRTDIASLLSASQVLVLPYRVGYGTQSFPNTILEAFYVGVPLVTTRVDPVQEIFQTHPQAGILVEPEDPAALAQEVLKLLQDESLQKQMIGEQQKLARQLFVPPVIAQRYMSEVYENVNH